MVPGGKEGNSQASRGRGVGERSAGGELIQTCDFLTPDIISDHC